MNVICVLFICRYDRTNSKYTQTTNTDRLWSVTETTALMGICDSTLVSYDTGNVTLGRRKRDAQRNNVSYHLSPKSRFIHSNLSPSFCIRYVRFTCDSNIIAEVCLFVYLFIFFSIFFFRLFSDQP